MNAILVSKALQEPLNLIVTDYIMLTILYINIFNICNLYHLIKYVEIYYIS